MIEQIAKTTFQALMLTGDKVEVGDITSADFKPHLKLNRWDGECFVGIGFPTTLKGTPLVSGDKVTWSSTNLDIAFYPQQVGEQNDLGGYEFEIILKKKPTSNKILLNIETQGLKFYYQPELTPEEVAGGAIRPDNVVGSYAVYHATRTNIHRSKEDADKYKAGKAFHIYRPKVKDATGKEIWADLNVDEIAGTLTITIDLAWLNSAVYPVSIDPNFGYETKGATAWTGANVNRIAGSWATGAVGTITSITAYYLQYLNYLPKRKHALYEKTGALTGNYIANSGTEEWTITSGWNNWKTLNVASPPTISAIDYWIAIWGVSQPTLYMDSATGKTGYETYTYDGWPATITQLNLNYIVSIYCTYTVGGWANIAKVNGVAAASMSKMNNVAVASIAKVSGKAV